MDSSELEAISVRNKGQRVPDEESCCSTLSQGCVRKLTTDAERVYPPVMTQQKAVLGLTEGHSWLKAPSERKLAISIHYVVSSPDLLRDYTFPNCRYVMR